MTIRNSFSARACLTFFLSALLYAVYAQQPPPPTQVQYSYDAAGNRTKRMIIATPQERIQDTTVKEPNEQAMQMAMRHGISVYPNPATTDNITVTISSLGNKTNESATISLLDNTGKMLFSQKLNVTKSASGGQITTSPSQIDINSYSSGIYFVKVLIGKEQLFYKVTKAK